VTDSEWRNATDPTTMLEFLRVSGNATDRKLRLFGMACCRRVWRYLTDERGRRAVDAAEGHADGVLTSGIIVAVRAAAHEALFEAKDAEYRAEAMAKFGESIAYCGARATFYSASAALLAVSVQAGRNMAVLDAYQRDESQWRGENALGSGCHSWAAAAVRLTERVRQYQDEGLSDHASPPPEIRERGLARGDDARRLEGEAQAHLLRDMFGLLQYRPVAVGPEVLAWNDRLVVRLARAIYDERRWSDLTILADALLDAGCQDEGILTHCREQGSVHVRGCWVIDLLLGKE
jgi:hypothetical protein